MQTKKTKGKTKTTLKASRRLIEAMVMTAIFTAMAVCLKSVTKITIPIMGAGGMAISFAGIFSFFPAILYGPLYGGASSALCDFLGWLIKPDGPYNPLFTIVAFMGGCIKGVIWLIIARTSVPKKLTKGVLITLFALILALGCVFTAALNLDGVISGVYAEKTDLPFKGELDTESLNPFSRIAASLAKYQKDTLTLTSITVPSDGSVIIPTWVETDGELSNITKMDASVFNTEGLKSITVPDTVKTIIVPEGFEFTNTELKVFSLPIPKTLKDFAEKYEISISEDVGYDYVATSIKTLSLNPENDYFSFASSDTYRKYLAGYLNFTTLGFILSGALGLFFMLAFFLLGKLGVLKTGEKSHIYLCVLPAVLLSGLAVTTVNTFVLLETVATYAGRAFWVFYIPRLAEEIFVSVVQSYVITILITALSANKTFSKLLKIK